MCAADRDGMMRTHAAAYARVALANIQREYPASVQYYLTAPGPIPSPRERHPSFYGSLDWHSCVEMHWVLVRLMRMFPSLAVGPAARAVLSENLSAEKLAREAAYLGAHRGFERPYGWGWALTLAHELSEWNDGDASSWAANITALADVIRAGFLAWLPKATYPQRTGLHGNSAFALLLALDFAEREARRGHDALRRAITEAARRWYEADAGYVARFEPSGSDFLSPALTEAALLSRILDRENFTSWLGRFLPSFEPLLLPAEVSDPTDGQIAHLHGLNLSRAYCMRVILRALPEGDARVAPFTGAIAAHARASLPHVVGSDYMVEHWLAAYAVLLLS